jgi:hypothetical protein
MLAILAVAGDFVTRQDPEAGMYHQRAFSHRLGLIACATPLLLLIVAAFEGFINPNSWNGFIFYVLD